MTDQTRAAMALLLAHGNVDLGDERAVISLLRSAGNQYGDIVLHSDAATERARELRVQSETLELK